jgi:hypothetical protein
MNLQSWSKKVAETGKNVSVRAEFFRQMCGRGLLYPRRIMCLSVRAASIAASVIAVSAVWILVLAAASPVQAQTNYYAANGSEYQIVGSLAGDQVFPDAAISKTNGFVVWQDNATDGDGWGISARRLDSTLSGTLSTFRVNATGAGDQENARVALLKNGGAVFAWQGGIEGYQHIFARFLTPTNTFLTTTDLVVSVFRGANSFQVNPALAVLTNGNVVITWASFNQASSNSLLDVYAKILSPTGVTVSNEFRVNQFTNFNQRTPAVAALKNGGFVVSWVSEMERVRVGSVDETNGTLQTSIPTPSVDIYARIFQGNGTPAGNEFLVNTASRPCANPSVTAGSDGGFMVGWSGRDLVVLVNRWDIYGRIYSSPSSGAGGNVILLNTYVYGNQYAPHLTVIGSEYLALWTSMGQDGSREGIYGQFIHNNGALVGGEFRVSTTTIAQQMQPAIASDGANQFIAVWTSYTGSPYNFDLFAQRYLNASAVLQPMSAPYVFAPFNTVGSVYQPQLQVTWAPVLGISVTNYEVYLDGGLTPVALVTSNQWVMTAANGLSTNNTHSFQVDYVTADGRRSSVSPSASGTTWSGLNWGGIPYEWMVAYYGGYIGGKYYVSNWPQAGAAVGAGGMTLTQVFASGGNPLDSNTWLRQDLKPTSQGMFLSWNTRAGSTYQVMISTNLAAWVNLGSPRFAAGTNDSLYVGGSAASYYRIILLR